MHRMKLSIPFALGAVLGILLAVSDAMAGERPSQTTCVTETQRCTDAGVCTRAIPDAGLPRYTDGGAGTIYDSDSGVSLANVQSYTVEVCGTAARPLAGAGSLQDYHCKPGKCSIISANTQYVTLTGTATTLCQEYPEFFLRAFYPAQDRMIWAASGVTISNPDGGAADSITVTVCPAK